MLEAAPLAVMALDAGGGEPLANTTTRTLNVSGHDGPSHETMEEHLERLGRQRPAQLPSIWAEMGFVFSIVMSQILVEFLLSGFTVILPTVAEDLDIGSASQTWPASAPSLVIASFLLVFGRISDMIGGYPTYVGGMIWLTIWCLIAGFSNGQIMLNICRAFQGLGASAFLSSGIMIMGSVYRPGPRKNIVFSIYGGCAAVGFYIGILVAGMTAQFATWRWMFWIGAMLAATSSLTSYFYIPSDMVEKRAARASIKMDWPGSALIVVGLVLLNFAIIDSSHAPNRWQNPYILTTLIIGVLCLLLAIPTEARWTSQPLLPASLLRIPSMASLIVALFLTYGSLGVYLLYATYYMQLIMGASPLQVTAWYTPLALGGIIIGTGGGFILHRIPGTLLIVLAGVSWILAPLLFAIMPVGASYWSHVFPSMILATIGIDTTYNVANVFITTSLPKAQQGLAGAVASLTLHLGISLCLGFSDIVYTYVRDDHGQRRSYQAVFWYEVGAASLALCILVLGVKIKKAESELTVDERLAADMSMVPGERDAMDADGDEEKASGLGRAMSRRSLAPAGGLERVMSRRTHARENEVSLGVGQGRSRDE